MTSVILTHHTSYMMTPDYLWTPSIKIPISYIMIEVTFDKTYTLMFHELIPQRIKGYIGCNVVHVDRKRYIRDIPYFPDTIIDAIKLMNVRGTRPLTGAHTSTYSANHPGGYIKKVYMPIGDTSEGDDLFNSLFKIFAKIKTEHEKKQTDTIDTHNTTMIRLQNAYDRMHLIEFESDVIRDQKNVLQQSLENSLQKNEKLSDDLKTLEETVAELRKINEVLAILIDAEKLKKSSLSKKLSNITDLYKDLLSATVCKQG